MSTTTEQPAQVEKTVAERPERREPTYLFTEKYVADKSELARKFLDTRERLNANMDKASSASTILITTAIWKALCRRKPKS
jgi:hypothetical protein